MKEAQAEGRATRKAEALAIAPAAEAAWQAAADAVADYEPPPTDAGTEPLTGRCKAVLTLRHTNAVKNLAARLQIDETEAEKRLQAEVDERIRHVRQKVEAHRRAADTRTRRLALVLQQLGLYAGSRPEVTQMDDRTQDEVAEDAGTTTPTPTAPQGYPKAMGGTHQAPKAAGQRFTDLRSQVG